MILAAIASLWALQSEELAEAARKSSSLERYAFTVETRAGLGKHQAGAIEGRYQKDQPLALRTAGVEGFKKGGAVVYQDGEEWKRLERARKGGKKEPPGVAAFADVKLPHEELEGFEKNFEKVEKAAEKDKDCAVWSGVLTPAAARSLVSSGGKADGKSLSTYTGTARLWVNDQGLIVRYEVSVHIKDETKKGTINADLTKTVQLAQPGSATVEVPEAAAKLLRSQP
jgi:hypothetical protein